MLQIKVRNTGAAWALTAIFYLLLFQNPLATIPGLSYIDEAFALLGVLLLVHRMTSTGKLIIQKINLKIVFALCVLVVSGLAGNFIYRYQVTSSVLVDLFTVLKFFLSIITGYELFRRLGREQIERTCRTHAKFAAFMLFMLVIVDLFFHVFDYDGTRYGLRVVQLMYGHPTYLASAAVFLLALLTIFYERKNGIYILMACTVLFFTLRSKAVAGIAAYGLIFFFLLHRRKKMRVWYIVLIAAVAFLVAQDQILYYYVEMREESARAALTTTSFQIMQDYFPIGTGFGTFASSEAAKNYSQVYFLYDLNSVYGLSAEKYTFSSDTFWPIIMGQTGVIGTISYVYVLIQLFRGMVKIRKDNNVAYAGGVFTFAYLLISSTSESAFCNPAATPLAMVLGFIFAWQWFIKEEKNEKTQRHGDRDLSL